MADLSILIPSRNEPFLKPTVVNLLSNIEGDTEIIVVSDGQWPLEGLEDNERVTLIKTGEAVGQRAAINTAARLSRAKYVMKIDAHCAVDKGFDVKMLKAFDEVGDNVTMVPAMYNLHAFDWRCKKCGNRWYQGPTPTFCHLEGEERKQNHQCDGQEFERVMVWQPRTRRRSEFYRFDTTLHFQYHGARKAHPEAQGDLVETMSLQGSCFMMTRDKYWQLGVCEETFGSWGQQGVEVACKTWLSGGRVLTNKRTWYAHMFRTQGGDFGFPYPLSQKQVSKAREYSRELFLYNKWPQQVYPLSWLLDKFAPLPDWHDKKGEEVLELVRRQGEKFNQNHPLLH